MVLRFSLFLLLSLTVVGILSQSEYEDLQCIRNNNHNHFEINLPDCSCKCSLPKNMYYSTDLSNMSFNNKSLEHNFEIFDSSNTYTLNSESAETYSDKGRSKSKLVQTSNNQTFGLTDDSIYF